MTRIHGMFNMTVSNDQRSQYNDLQSLLCATLQAVVRKIKPQDIAQIADKCMEALLKMMEYVQYYYKITCITVYHFSTSPGVGSVQEDALQTVGALIEVVGNDFIRYMDQFNPFLCQALKNYQESSVSRTVNIFDTIVIFR